MPTADAKPARRSRWPWIIAGMLGVHMLIMAVAAVIATHDRSFAVVNDYYDRAINWDQSQALLRASQQMGWKIEIQAPQEIDPLGRRQTTFVLTDSAGREIPGAVLNVEYFHDAHASQPVHATLSPEPEDGRRFTERLPMRYSGVWEFHFTVTAERQTYVVDKTQMISNVAPSSVGEAVNG